MTRLLRLWRTWQLVRKGELSYMFIPCTRYTGATQSHNPANVLIILKGRTLLTHVTALKPSLSTIAVFYDVPSAHRTVESWDELMEFGEKLRKPDWPHGRLVRMPFSVWYASSARDDSTGKVQVGCARFSRVWIDDVLDMVASHSAKHPIEVSA